MSDERTRIRSAVQRVNRLAAKANGIQYEVLGWEDVVSATSDRTQEVINPAVAECDIFIGILSKRFGQPTGRAESGTRPPSVAFLMPLSDCGNPYIRYPMS